VGVTIFCRIFFTFSILSVPHNTAMGLINVESNSTFEYIYIYIYIACIGVICEVKHTKPHVYDNERGEPVGPRFWVFLLSLHRDFMTNMSNTTTRRKKIAQNKIIIHLKFLRKQLLRPLLILYYKFSMGSKFVWALQNHCGP
jgi:hypothetical protein